jgi:hypothetical protein
VGCSGQQTTDGGYIIAGGTDSYGAGTEDVWLIKTDTNGYETWNRTFGGRNADEGRSVQQTTDGGYILTGFTMSFGAGDADMWLIKTDTNGYETWNKTFGGPINDASFSVQQTTDGGYIMTGLTDAWGVATLALLIKTDDAGNKIWDKSFRVPNYDCGGYSVQQTSDGGYILTGQAGFNYNYNVLLIKTDSNGDETWNRTFGGTNPVIGLFVQQTTDGGYIITGWKNSFRTGNDIWLIKTDSSGNMIWDRTFGGTSGDEGWCVKQTSDGGYIITGTIDSDVCLIKTDSQGKAKTTSLEYFWFERLSQRFPNVFPLLR